MLEAALWGAVAASSLLVGMAIALAWTAPKVGLGLVLAFGAGALFSAIAFDLADSHTYPTGAVHLVLRPPGQTQHG